MREPESGSAIEGHMLKFFLSVVSNDKDEFVFDTSLIAQCDPQFPPIATQSGKIVPKPTSNDHVTNAVVHALASANMVAILMMRRCVSS